MGHPTQCRASPVCARTARTALAESLTQESMPAPSAQTLPVQSRRRAFLRVCLSGVVILLIAGGIAWFRWVAQTDALLDGSARFRLLVAPASQYTPPQSHDPQKL